MADAEKSGPVLIELDDDEAPNVADAPPVSEPVQAADGQAMQRLAELAARPPSRWARWFWSITAGFFALVLSVSAWDFVTGLLARNSVLGGVAAALSGAFLLLLLILTLREWAALARLGRIDGLRQEAETAERNSDAVAARQVSERVTRLYASRQSLRWSQDRLAEQVGQAVDADTILLLTERELLSPVDVLARREIEAAARQVATVTALVPLALADIAVALTANLRMIRRIAVLYGGRGGVLGSWRLTRSVLTHLVATGAVAVGDDLIGSIAGGGLLSKISRRFGEGVVNGALTARVGVAAMEVCRPLPFRDQSKPSVTGLVRRALTGVFSSES